MAESGPQSDRFVEARALVGRIADSTQSRADSLRANIDVLRSGQVAEATWEDGEDDGG